jgi:hypothetical protein
VRALARLALAFLLALAALAIAPADAHAVGFGGSKTRIRASTWILPSPELSDRPLSGAGAGAADVVYGGRQEARYFDQKGLLERAMGIALDPA